MIFSKLFASVVIFSGCVYTYSPVFFNNPNSWDDVTKNPTNTGSSMIHMNEWKNVLERKMCGESLKHVAGLVVDKTDKEAKVIVEGSIRSNKLILKLGCVKEKEIYIKNILLPIETVSSKCINIRLKTHEDSTILCLENKFMRNFWNNSITDAVLCHETKVKGKLPQYKYSEENKNGTEEENKDGTEEENKDGTEEENKDRTGEENKNGTEEENKNGTEEENKDRTAEENKDGTDEDTKNQTIEETKETMNEENNKESQEILHEGNTKIGTMEQVNNEEEAKTNDEWKQNILKEEFEDEVEKNEEQKGLKLRIAKSKYGYPKVKINGTDIQELKKNNKTGELRSTSVEDKEIENNLENEMSQEIEESTTE